MPRAKKQAEAPVAQTILAIKGFDSSLQCRGFQFEAGKTYKHDGKVVACQSGFHAIGSDANPLAVFQYYPPAGSRFFRVELSGELHSDDGEKTAAEILTVGTEIGLKELAEEAVAWITERATEKGEHTKGDQSASTSTGYRSASTSTGDRSASTSTGYQSASTSTGDQSASTSTGYQSASTSTGYRSASTSTGYRSASTSTGYRSASTSTGDRSVAMSCGREGKVRASKIGSALFAVERDDYWNITSVACGIVGQNDLKPDTWYVCRSGQLVEA